MSGQKQDFGVGGGAWHVGRTLRMLDLLTFAPMSTAQVAEAMGSQPWTVRRVLNKLVQDGFVTVHEVGRRRVFEVTMRLPAMAGQMVERSPLRPLARPLVELVHERTGATAHLVVPSYWEVLCLVHAGPSEREARPRLREMVPATCTAGGKALLAWRHDWRESLLAQPLTRHTDQTVVEADRLRRELARVRVDGWATELDECCDHTPSLHAYSEPKRGWYCYGCGKGGSIYDFAAELWHTTTRGRDFPKLRRRLHDRFAPTRGRTAQRRSGLSR